MREVFLDYAKRGAMTIDELALVIRRKPSWVRTHSAGANALIPRIPGKPIRFDPMAMIEVFCKTPRAPEEPRRSSLTIERHKTGVAKDRKEYGKCL